MQLEKFSIPAFFLALVLTSFSAQACLYDDEMVQADLLKASSVKAEGLLGAKPESSEPLHYEANYIRTDSAYECPDQFVSIAKFTVASGCSAILSAIDNGKKIRISMISKSCR